MENFSINYIKDIAVIKIDLPTATMRDSQTLWNTMTNGSLFDHQKLVVDLSSCSFIDSTFIGMIVKIFKGVSEKQNVMKLVFPQITDTESFRVVGIAKIIECFTSIDNAIQSFDPDSPVSKIDIDEKGLYHKMTGSKQ